jgi:hypothetical protein
MAKNDAFLINEAAAVAPQNPPSSAGTGASAGNRPAVRLLFRRCLRQHRDAEPDHRPGEAEPVLNSFALLSKRMGADVTVNGGKATLKLYT